jgi:hypothetical protein
VSTPVSFVQEVILESHATAINVALMRYLEKFLLLRIVGKEEGLFICRARQVVMHLCEVSSECAVQCVCVY